MQEFIWHHPDVDAFLIVALSLLLIALDAFAFRVKEAQS